MRSDEIIGQHVERATWRIEELRRVAKTARADPLLDKLLNELQLSVEELQVSEEELRQQHDALMESRELLEAEYRRFQDLFDSAPCAYLVTDAAGVIRNVNETGLRLLGRTTELVIGKPLVVFVPEEHRRGFRRRLAALREAGAVLEWEMVIEPRNGRPIVVSARVGSADAHGGAQLRWILQDESERRAVRAASRGLVREQVARKEAERAERELRNVLDSLPAGFFTLDPERRFVFVNSATSRILGRPRAELAGQEIWKIFPEAIGSAFFHGIEAVLNERVSSEFREYYAPRNMDFDVHAYPLELQGAAVYLRAAGRELDHSARPSTLT
jgi:PAS domain S-box-containing protein